MLVSTNLPVLVGPAQRRDMSRPEGCATLVFFSLSACTRLSRVGVTRSRNPIGSEKACQIALDCDPRTPLFGDRSERDSYSKVLLTESPKIYNGKVGTLSGHFFQTGLEDRQ